MPPAIGLNLPASGPHEPGDADRFEQHGPQDGLLVDDRLVPPLADVPEGPQMRGRGGQHEPQAGVEERQLHEIDAVDHLRRPEAVLDPVERQRPHAVHEWLVQKRFGIHRRELGRLEPHPCSSPFWARARECQGGPSTALPLPGRKGVAPAVSSAR